jgi:hypothetical protein
MQYEERALASIKLFADVGIQPRDQAATHYQRASCEQSEHIFFYYYQLAQDINIIHNSAVNVQKRRLMTVDDDLAALYHQIYQVSAKAQYALNTLHLTSISTEMHEKTMSTLQQLWSQYGTLVLDAKALADQSSGSLLPRYTNQHPIFDLPFIANLPQLEQ